MRPYYHEVQYYETDMMGIVHHSNYVRFFEEARTDLGQQMGIPYAELEAAGIMSPVLSVGVKYKHPLRYGDVAKITVHIKKVTGAKLLVSYEVYNRETGDLCAVGESCHGYVDKDFRPVSLKRVKPEWYALYKQEEEKDLEATHE